ncbi:Usp8 protein, variant 2 [Capsaspora owczarzaki ATCC 30864]|uniref:Usp8 protein, variant 2 n=1 Tax=Capsaspora owczarzaki (strain ATCC 30864) TaxID=595528 RepID=A0A0D2VLI8_CAPO3|nr:Usp8 protein, variant 2 [Capsaspora owczarzaki ATCC 30864]
MPSVLDGIGDEGGDGAKGAAPPLVALRPLYISSTFSELAARPCAIDYTPGKGGAGAEDRVARMAHKMYTEALSVMTFDHERAYVLFLHSAELGVKLRAGHKVSKDEAARLAKLVTNAMTAAETLKDRLKARYEHEAQRAKQREREHQLQLQSQEASKHNPAGAQGPASASASAHSQSDSPAAQLAASNLTEQDASGTRSHDHAAEGSYGNDTVGADGIADATASSVGSQWSAGASLSSSLPSDWSPAHSPGPGAAGSPRQHPSAGSPVPSKQNAAAAGGGGGGGANHGKGAAAQPKQRTISASEVFLSDQKTKSTPFLQPMPVSTDALANWSVFEDAGLSSNDAASSIVASSSTSSLTSIGSLLHGPYDHLGLITPQEFFQMMNSKLPNHLAVLDMRSASEIASCALRWRDAATLPPQLLKANTSIGDLIPSLPRACAELLSRRTEFEHVVVVTAYGNATDLQLEEAPVRILFDSIYKWDFSSSPALKNHLRYLSGGISTWQTLYPALCITQSPLAKHTLSSSLPAHFGQTAISYPSLMTQDQRTLLGEAGIPLPPASAADRQLVAYPEVPRSALLEELDRQAELARKAAIRAQKEQEEIAQRTMQAELEVNAREAAKRAAAEAARVAVEADRVARIAEQQARKQRQLEQEQEELRRQAAAAQEEDEARLAAQQQAAAAAAAAAASATAPPGDSLDRTTKPPRAVFSKLPPAGGDANAFSVQPAAPPLAHSAVAAAAGATTATTVIPVINPEERAAKPSLTSLSPPLQPPPPPTRASAPPEANLSAPKPKFDQSVNRQIATPSQPQPIPRGRRKSFDGALPGQSPSSDMIGTSPSFQQQTAGRSPSTRSGTSPSASVMYGSPSAAPVQSSAYGGVGDGLTGLRNLGNTCFMNSMLQCLSHTMPVTAYFISNKFRQDVNRYNRLGRGGILAESFSELLRNLWLQRFRCFSPSDFLGAVCRFGPQFAGGEQHDSQELLAFLLDGLHEDLNTKGLTKNNQQLITQSDGTRALVAALPNRDQQEEEDEARRNMPVELRAERAWQRYKQRNDSVIVDMFQGLFKSSIQCDVCRHASITFSPFMFLSLPIPLDKTHPTLADCIELFTRSERIDGENQWFCERCRQHRSAVKSLQLWKLPPVLLIHFKRFYYDGPWRDKLHHYVEFPLDNLDMNPHVIHSARRPSTDARIPIAPYHLYAVSNHEGTMEGGHYIASCRNPISRQWYQFDDSVVRRLTTSVKVGKFGCSHFDANSIRNFDFVFPSFGLFCTFYFFIFLAN